MFSILPIENARSGVPYASTSTELLHSPPPPLPLPFHRWPHSVDHNAKFGANNLASQLLEEFQEVADIINFLQIFNLIVFLLICTV